MKIANKKLGTVLEVKENLVDSYLANGYVLYEEGKDERTGTVQKGGRGNSNIASVSSPDKPSENEGEAGDSRS